MKGQARKAKAKAAAEESKIYRFELDGHGNINPNSTIRTTSCDHGQEELDLVCAQFTTTFYQSYAVKMSFNQTYVALNKAYSMHPEAVNNEYNREMVKKSIISNGVGYLLGMRGTNNKLNDLKLSYGSAIALMLIDSYALSSPLRLGNFDERDAKELLTNMDVSNGCQRSLVKFFAKRTPCNCLDGLYTKMKLAAPKMSACPGCVQTKPRRSMLICTGCERVQYCSKLCQLKHVPIHKDLCKRIQAGYINGSKVC